MDSMLTSIKKMLGIAEDCTDFDVDLIIHINSVLGILNQLGVGPDTGFSITDKSDEWMDFVADMSTLEFVTSYVFLKVRMLFDPPTSGAITESINRMIRELECRILIAADKPQS